MPARPVVVVGLLVIAVVAALLVSARGSDSRSGDDGAPAASRPRDAQVAPEPPALRDPEVLPVIDGRLRLADDRDYVLQLPCSPVEVEGGLRISGGRNVVLVGGTVVLPEDEDPARGLYLVDQTGTVHIEGLHLTGNLSEGINLSQSKGAAVHLVNVRVDVVRGSKETNHADLLQTWAGPRELTIDGFVGETEYQGFFLLPNQHYDGPPPERFSLSNIHITMGEDAGYALWTERGRPDYPVEVDRVWLTPSVDKPQDDLLWPKPSVTDDQTWSGVRIGTPDEGVLSQEPGTEYPRWGDQCA